VLEENTVMKLLILLPSNVLLDEDVLQVRAESEQGEFCLKPRHIDFVTALVPSILSYVDEIDDEYFVAVDSGILVKRGQQVSLATRHAVPGELGELDEVVQNIQENSIEREKISRSAAARLEIGFYKRFMELSG
jgi:F-type H+-transporting ATPase subunit epsilon